LIEGFLAVRNQQEGMPWTLKKRDKNGH
jgi:hypothetical protein